MAPDVTLPAPASVPFMLTPPMVSFMLASMPVAAGGGGGASDTAAAVSVLLALSVEEVPVALAPAGPAAPLPPGPGAGVGAGACDMDAAAVGGPAIAETMTEEELTGHVKTRTVALTPLVAFARVTAAHIPPAAAAFSSNSEAGRRAVMKSACTR